jgi:hypothetical protein
MIDHPTSDRSRDREEGTALAVRICPLLSL